MGHWEDTAGQIWATLWGCPSLRHPPAQPLPGEELMEPGEGDELLWASQPRVSSLLTYLHEDFAQRYKRRAQLCCEDAAHEEVPQLSPEVL